MRKKALPLLGAVAAFGLMVLLFKPEAASSSSPPPDRRVAMPEFQAAGLDGHTAWKLSDHRGKVVLLNFWASWCPPCRMETPGLVRLAREYAGKGLEVAGVAMDDSDQLGAVRRFVSERQIPYPILLPPPGDPLAAKVESLPTTLLIDPQGRVAKTYYGAESENVFRQDIDRLLAER